MTKFPERPRRVIAAALPLALLALVVLSMLLSTREGLGSSIEAACAASAICGLGPLSWFAVLHWPLAAGFAVSGVLWSAYTLGIVFTRFGSAPAWVYAVISTAWCGAGLIVAVYAGGGA